MTTRTPQPAATHTPDPGDKQTSPRRRDAAGTRQLLLDEEVRFRKLLERGRHVISHERFRRPLNQEDFDYLHETHGLPRELVQSLLLEPSLRCQP